MTPATLPAAARKLLDCLADATYSLTGERRTEGDGIRYLLKRTEHHEVILTREVPATLVAGLCSKKLLDGKETRKPGLALFINYEIATERRR